MFEEVKQGMLRSVNCLTDENGCVDKLVSNDLLKSYRST